MSFLLSLQDIKRSRCCTVFLFLFFCLSAGLSAQTSQPSPQQGAPIPPAQPSQQTPDNIQRAPDKIAVQVKTVSVLATVRDKHGKIISDLKKEDFALEEDGRTQTINYFARESDLALRLGLLVDTSLSQRNVLDQERTASYSFLDHLLRENKDLAFIIHFDREVELLQDFTPSRPKLQAALQHLDTPQFSGGRGGGGNNGGGSSGGGGSSNGGGNSGGGGRGQGRRGGAGTLLYDAIYLASDELMSKQQGRKALIILSDGVDHGSKETLAEAIESAQRADAVIYSILFKDDENHGYPVGMMGPHGGYGGGRHGGGGRPPQEDHPDGKKILTQISKATGGRLYEVSKKETVDKIYAQIEEELRNQYSLGYTPDKDTGAGYHKIQLTTKNKDLTVQARDGYYSNQ
ncbi:MAG TPA: VWA domain-containing protein [Candidatus Acidoferrum sp.]|nr:VWA domain-containing protein [Candidatus Acidoferrum sp.]